MARFGIIAVLIGLLLADPVLCRSVDTEGACRGRCGAVHGQQPSDACHGPVHGCVCQGATNTVSSRQHEELALSAPLIPLLHGPWPDLLIDHALPPSVLPPPSDADGFPTGRSLRIAHQSFQI